MKINVEYKTAPKALLNFETFNDFDKIICDRAIQVWALQSLRMSIVKYYEPLYFEPLLTDKIMLFPLWHALKPHLTTRKRIEDIKKGPLCVPFLSVC